MCGPDRCWPSPCPTWPHAVIADSLSMAFLVVSETLAPTECAVFLVREMLAYESDEIATVIDKSSDNCRQLLVRPKHIDERRPRYEASREQKRELSGRFFAAVQAGDIAGLQTTLAADFSFNGDGTGKAPAVAHAVVGFEKVANVVSDLASLGTSRA